MVRRIKGQVQMFQPKPEAFKRMIEVAPATGPGSIEAMWQMARDTIKDAPKYLQGRKLKLRTAQVRETSRNSD